MYNSWMSNKQKKLVSHHRAIQCLDEEEKLLILYLCQINSHRPKRVQRASFLLLGKGRHSYQCVHNRGLNRMINVLNSWYMKVLQSFPQRLSGLFFKTKTGWAFQWIHKKQFIYIADLWVLQFLITTVTNHEPSVNCLFIPRVNRISDCTEPEGGFGTECRTGQSALMESIFWSSNNVNIGVCKSDRFNYNQ